MSAEVVFNEVWTEDHSTLFSSFLSFFFPPFPLRLEPPASDRNRQTERQRHMAHRALAGVGGKAMVELIGENGSFFSPPYLPIHHHVITARAPLAARERHFKDFLPGRRTSVGPVLFRCLRARECMHAALFSPYATRVCVERSRSSWMCCSPRSKKKPAHSHS